MGGGGGDFERQLGQEGGALAKETPESPSPLPPREDSGRGWPSVYSLEMVLTMT